MYGFYMECGRVHSETLQLVDSLPGKKHSLPPVILFHPSKDRKYPEQGEMYECPVYKTSERMGVLNTQGNSTNFIIMVDCPSTKPEKYWVLQASAMLC